MIVAVMGGNSEIDKDYSFVREEMKKLKDIPKTFDYDLYKKIGISDTVLSYWQEIKYIPPYYYLFCLLQSNRWEMNWDEYMKICDMLVGKIVDENEKIGEAVKEFSYLEKQGYDWFIKSERAYVYILSYSYSDNSGDNLICTYDYDKVVRCMQKEIESDEKDVIFKVIRFPVIYSDDGEFEGIDLTDYQGEISFDKYGKLKYVENIKGYGYNPMCTMKLTMPYFTMPYPFTKGDIVSFRNGDEMLYGIVASLGDESADELEARGVILDGSDFQIRVETIYEKDGVLFFEHNHLSPLVLDKYTEDIDYGKKDIFSSLGVASEIITGKNGNISELFYFMGL